MYEVLFAADGLGTVIHQTHRYSFVHFGRSRSRCKGPALGPGSTLDKTKEILNDRYSLLSF